MKEINMAKKTDKKKNKMDSKELPSTEDSYFLNDEAEDYKFSDYVRISSYPHGMILYFGKFQPDKNKYGIFEGILIPYDVAGSLVDIIKNHISKLVDKGLLEKKDSEKG